MTDPSGVPSSSHSTYARARRVLLTLLGVYAVLVATHRGEFWPMSIYPMFSQAGRPWTRAVVRQIEPDAVVQWDVCDAADLPGQPFALAPRSIGQNDVANFVAKTQTWDERRVAGLRRLFDEHLRQRALVFYAARGRLDEQGGIRIEYEPVIVLRPDGSRLSPSILAQEGRVRS